MHDLVIRGGLVVDGTGAGPVPADVAVDGDTIVDMGPDVGAGAGQLDADGRLVTPGFVDLHTHLDAQLGWDPLATSSCWHGVTSLVLGNCGMTFAPVRPGEAGFLARIMESVEDIPADVDPRRPPLSLGELRRATSLARRPAEGRERRRFRGPLRGALPRHGRALARPRRRADRRRAGRDGAPASTRRWPPVPSASRPHGPVVTSPPTGATCPGTWAGERELVALAEVLGSPRPRVLRRCTPVRR